jgi:hypothetical protein
MNVKEISTDSIIADLRELARKAEEYDSTVLMIAVQRLEELKKLRRRNTR